MGSFNASLLAALLSAGVSPERAREVVEQFDRAIDERFGLHAQILATKRDLAELEVRLTERIAESRADLVKWMLAALTAQTALIVGALKVL